MIAEGSFDAEGKFRANTILAKHDEKYVPKEIRETMAKKEALDAKKPQAEPKSY